MTLSGFFDRVRNIRNVVGGTFEVAHEIYEHARILRLTLALVQPLDMRGYEPFPVPVDFVLLCVDVGKTRTVFIYEGRKRQYVKVFDFFLFFFKHFQKLA